MFVPFMVDAMWGPDFDHAGRAGEVRIRVRAALSRASFVQLATSSCMVISCEAVANSRRLAQRVVASRAVRVRRVMVPFCARTWHRDRRYLALSRIHFVLCWHGSRQAGRGQKLSRTSPPSWLS